MREFCAKHFSRQALQQRMQNVVKKVKTQNDNEGTATEKKTKSETVRSALTKMNKRWKNFTGGYRDFLFLGNGIQWAVAFILGGGFLQLISHFTSAFITPWLGVIFGQTDFWALTFTINGSVFPYGRFIDTLITFLIITLVLYFAVVLPSKWLTDKFAKKEESNQTTCVYCCSTISREATRCPYCTSKVEPLAVTNLESVSTKRTRSYEDGDEDFDA